MYYYVSEYEDEEQETIEDKELVDALVAASVETGTLNLSNCGIKMLPNLPPCLQDLDISENPLRSLPSLPKSLIKLNCSDCNLRSLPSLPNTLQYLLCDGNKLEQLPELPPNLVVLHCEQNRLAQLPLLPKSLRNLETYHNPWKPPYSECIGSISAIRRMQEVLEAKRLAKRLYVLQKAFERTILSDDCICQIAKHVTNVQGSIRAAIQNAKRIVKNNE